MKQLLIQYAIVDLEPNNRDDIKLCKALASSEFWMQTGIGSTATFKSINFVPGSPELEKFEEECKSIGINFS